MLLLKCTLYFAKQCTNHILFSVSPVFDYSYRDYVLSWYVPLSRDEGQLYQMLSEDFWEMAKQLRGRLADVDMVNVVCNDTVKTLHAHFCDLKTANTRYRRVWEEEICLCCLASSCWFDNHRS